MMTAQEELDKLRPELRYLRVRVPQLDKARLAQKDRVDKLAEELRRVRKERNLFKKQNQKLEKELEKLKKQRDTYKGMIFKPNISLKREGQSGKTVGGQKGHLGRGRTTSKPADQIVRVFFKTCPHCSSPLTRSDSFETHTIEDIPSLELISTLVTLYKMERQWCSNCHREVVAKPKQIIPHSKLGLNLIVQIMIFKYVCRMSLEIMVATLNSTYGLKITEAGIINILQRTKKWLGRREYGKLLQAVRASPKKHADETTWRIAGLNGYLWAFLTEKEIYYTIEQTRGGGVAKEALDGSSKDDVLIRDDYSGYKNLPLLQQSCWAHLLRRSKEEVSQENCSKQMQALHIRLKAMYWELEEVIKQPFHISQRQQAYQYYTDKLNQMIKTKFRAKDAQRIRDRIKNQATVQGNNLLTALINPNTPLTNNAAERGIRKAVVSRKISGGSRSNKGAEAFAVNMSIIQTIRLRQEPLIPTLQTIILNTAAGNN